MLLCAIADMESSDIVIKSRNEFEKKKKKERRGKIIIIIIIEVRDGG